MASNSVGSFLENTHSVADDNKDYHDGHGDNLSSESTRPTLLPTNDDVMENDTSTSTLKYIYTVGKHYFDTIDDALAFAEHEKATMKRINLEKLLKFTRKAWSKSKLSEAKYRVYKSELKARAAAKKELSRADYEQYKKDHPFTIHCPRPPWEDIE